MHTYKWKAVCLSVISKQSTHEMKYLPSGYVVKLIRTFHCMLQHVGAHGVEKTSALFTDHVITVHPWLDNIICTCLDNNWSYGSTKVTTKNFYFCTLCVVIKSTSATVEAMDKAKVLDKVNKYSCSNTSYSRTQLNNLTKKAVCLQVFMLFLLRWILENETDATSL